MTDRHVRVSARGVVRRGDEILVARERDTTGGADGDAFYYLLGGGVEFGEHSAEALRREFDEELGVTVENVSHLETHEEVFDYDGRTEHEVARLYEADIAESWPYERDAFEGYEPDLDERIECVWKRADAFAADEETLYPEALDPSA
ncbi:NUDIX hydrolase [Halorussus amylolyticus]|uniref:NUDIX hydrolase n=1 Tax=Halorussus amylolyticus TaxID=1126242 RepID=UPI00104A3A88|nr:NUDIX domain-containing protein [Halorussus amylolyticus]